MPPEKKQNQRFTFTSPLNRFGGLGTRQGRDLLGLGGGGGAGSIMPMSNLTNRGGFFNRIGRNQGPVLGGGRGNPGQPGGRSGRALGLAFQLRFMKDLLKRRGRGNLPQNEDRGLLDELLGLRQDPATLYAQSADPINASTTARSQEVANNASLLGLAPGFALEAAQQIGATGSEQLGQAARGAEIDANTFNANLLNNAIMRQLGFAGSDLGIAQLGEQQRQFDTGLKLDLLRGFGGGLF